MFISFVPPQPKKFRYTIGLLFGKVEAADNGLGDRNSLSGKRITGIDN